MSRTKKLSWLSTNEPENVRLFQGHERPDKANRSRARAGQEPDNAEYLYTL